MKSSQKESEITDLAQRRMKKSLSRQHPTLLKARPYVEVILQSLSKLYKSSQVKLIRYEMESPDQVVCAVSLEYPVTGDQWVVVTGHYRMKLLNDVVVNTEVFNVSCTRR